MCIYIHIYVYVYTQKIKHVPNHQPAGTAAPGTMPLIMLSPCREARKMHPLGQPVLDVDAKASSEHLFCPGAQNVQKFAARS